jgi:hypothetical protein
MKTHRITTKCIITFASISLLGSSAPADETAGADKSVKAADSVATPQGGAPLMGLAVALPEDPTITAEYAWLLKVQVPKIVWQITGKRRPREEWTEIKAEVEMKTLHYSMGYHRATQLADRSQNRLVDLNGKRLSREEALKRLGKDTPVLVSISDMPDPYYLQFAKPDTLILLIGLADSEDYDLLPTSRHDDKHAEQDGGGQPAIRPESK